ncbi:MAG: penicillin-binding protein [Candidatus Pacebacteria bacterium CG10_big_fil_rev_8_21_14_0_10_42_12]|nr:MAG: penicillin-binding protein [Candidatus Pacebacteria bacterium CG10_big_fil_rev_8_21_14_0_10_42_12]
MIPFAGMRRIKPEAKKSIKLRNYLLLHAREQKYHVIFSSAQYEKSKRLTALVKRFLFLWNRSKLTSSPLLLSIIKWFLKITHLVRLPKPIAPPSLPKFSIRLRYPKLKFKSEPIKKIFKPFWQTLTLYPLQSLFMLATVTVIYVGTYKIHDYIFLGLPAVSTLREEQPSLTTRILDRNGAILYRIYKDENRTYVPLSEIPKQVIDATIAIEDQNFYYHPGFSLRGIIRAMIANKNGEVVQGGSTLTQQLVKNRLLTSERTLQRKVRELVLAVMVETEFTKDEILEMYLNQVAYGGSAYGIEEASQRYFGKSVRDISLSEASLLAGLPAAPSIYSPFGSNPELAKQRQAEVLRRMVEDGTTDAENAKEAYQTPLTFRDNTIDITAPHFVMYVKALLADQFSEEVIQSSGLEVVTSLDAELQNGVQNVVTTEIESLARLRVSNGAALITNPKTGEILAMVGSKDYFDFAHDGQVNVTIRNRQPGSSIKPLTYSLALASGLTPASIIQDSPITYDIAGSKPYSPKNYDGKYHGAVTLREALASSYNIPAVKLLAQVGVSNLLDYAEKLGITTWEDRRRFGLSLTLGGGEVKMTEMAQVYGVFANAGKLTKLNPILKISDSSGKVLYENTCALYGKGCPSDQVIDPRVAYLVTDILKDNEARTPAFGPISTLQIPNQEVAVKTGTTNNLRDNWTIGYTSDRVVAVWVGNNDNTSMSYVASGITGASPIWNKIIRSQLSEETPHVFPIPWGITKVQVCKKTGTLTCAGCPLVKSETFIAGTEPTSTCYPSQFKPKPDNDKILEGAQTRN